MHNPGCQPSGAGSSESYSFLQASSVCRSDRSGPETDRDFISEPDMNFAGVFSAHFSDFVLFLWKMFPDDPVKKSRDRMPDLPNSPDLEAFDRIYQQYAARMVVYARRFVDGKYAEDLVQDVFLRIWQQGHFRLPPAEFQPFLYRSVLNACRNLIRHDQVADKYARNSLKNIQLGEVEYELRILDEQRDDLTERLHAQIDALPERCREVFLLAWFENLRSPEIAERLRISRRTVDTQLYKALQLLRQRMLLPLLLLGALFFALS